MSLEADVRRLARVGPFAELPREALQLLAFSCPKRRLFAGEKLFTAGDPADGGFFVLEGEIALSASGLERRAGVGALIGETALIAETARAADAVAARDSTLLFVSRETFRRVLGEFPEGAARLRAAAAAKTGRLVARLDALRARDFPSERGPR